MNFNFLQGKTEKEKAKDKAKSKDKDSKRDKVPKILKAGAGGKLKKKVRLIYNRIEMVKN